MLLLIQKRECIENDPTEKTGRDDTVSYIARKFILYVVQY